MKGVFCRTRPRRCWAVGERHESLWQHSISLLRPRLPSRRPTRSSRGWRSNLSSHAPVNPANPSRAQRAGGQPGSLRGTAGCASGRIATSPSLPPAGMSSVKGERQDSTGIVSCYTHRVPEKLHPGEVEGRRGMPGLSRGVLCATGAHHTVLKEPRWDIST